MVTACCVVGAGPAGAVLALLLARAGVRVVLLEEHRDFDRDFRGDTIHPSVLEIMAELGLAERLLKLPHSEIRRLSLQTATGLVTIADFTRLRIRFPFVALLPQVEFLKFITAEAQRYPSFTLLMGARVEELIRDGGAIRGVRYRSPSGMEELRSVVTIATDGRFSTVRKLAGLEPIRTSAPMDVLWFRVPRHADDPESLEGGRLGRGRFVAILPRPDAWQLGYVIPKGLYQVLRAAGIEQLQRSVTDLVPEFADRAQTLTDWHDISLLSVESNRLKRWYQPGLLLLGDAAHTMSPIGGVGINYAIHDAVVAANVLTQPLLDGTVNLATLRSVQRRREWPTRVIQGFQALIQNQVMRGGLRSGSTAGLPWMVRLLLRTPVVRDLPARLIGLGIGQAHIQRKG